MKYRRALSRLLWLPVFLLLSFTTQAQDDELATIEFDSLQETYCVGDTVVADLVEIVIWYWFFFRVCQIISCYCQRLR